jgi:hypothetical protein
MHFPGEEPANHNIFGLGPLAASFELDVRSTFIASFGQPDDDPASRGGKDGGISLPDPDRWLRVVPSIESFTLDYDLAPGNSISRVYSPDRELVGHY